METRCKRIAPEDGGFIEKATVIFQGHELPAVGASEWTDKKGKHCFGLYVNTDTAMLTGWNGKYNLPCHLGRQWKSNFGDKRRAVYLRHNGKEYSGILYGEDWNMWVKLTERNSK